MISDWWKGMNGFKMEGWKDRARDWGMMARLKWEETGGCYLLVMLHKVLDQHTAQCLYPFIHSSLHSSEPRQCLHLFWVYLFLLPNHPFSLTQLLFPFLVISHYYHRSFSFPSISRFAFLLSLCLPVFLCVSAICIAWCECLALKETDVSLCVRNLTAQTTWHNETWQITAAVQKLTERHRKWAEAA